MKYIIHRKGKTRDEMGDVSLTREDGKSKKKISPYRSLKVRNHSPTGFEFGYGGSGPAQLALAILLDYTDDATCTKKHYQDFKFAFLGGMPHPGGEIEGEEIKKWLKQREEKIKKERTNVN